MQFDIITIFPEIFGSYLQESILKRAQEKKLIKVKIHNLRDFVKDKHKKVALSLPKGNLEPRRKIDDRPFGGGPGMVFKVEPLIRAVSGIKHKVLKKKPKIVLFNTTGKQFDEKMAQKLAKEKQLIMILILLINKK